jgi:hypothetical protein
MKKNIKESSAFVFDPTDGSRLIDGSFNISKIEDPIEFKRLNTYLSTVIGYNYDGNRRANLSGIRQKLNHIGFDFDLPKTVSESDKFSMRVPLKRFGGITGMGDDGKTLDNPYGPGPKFDISFETVGGILNAKIIPVGATYTTDSMQEAVPLALAAGAARVIPAIVTGARAVGAGAARVANSPAGREAISAVASTMTSKAIDKVSKKKEEPAMNEHEEMVEELLQIIDALCEELGIDPNELLNESQKDGNNKKQGDIQGRAILGSKQTPNEYQGSFVERLKRTHSNLQQVPHHERDEGWNDTHTQVTDLLNRHAAGEDITPPESKAREQEADRQSARRDRRAGITEPSKRQEIVSPDEDEADDVPAIQQTRSEIEDEVTKQARAAGKAAKAKKAAFAALSPEQKAAETARVMKASSVTEGLSFAKVMKRYKK